MAVEYCATRTCTKCGNEKPATADFFSPNKTGRFGLSAWCKPCKSAHEAARVSANAEEYARKKAREKERYIEQREERKANQRAFRLANAADIRARVKARREANPDKTKAESRAHYERNGEKVRQARAAYREKFPEKVRLSKQAHYRANKSAFIANNARRRAETIRATPPWSDRMAIAEKYKEAERLTKETGILHHVDHMVPLRGKTVCGLHVAYNLRVVPAKVNLSKSNKLIEELLAA